MTDKNIKILLSFFVAVSINSCAIFKTKNTKAATDKVPNVEREFRGVWVATVANIDWPSQRGLSSNAQIEEAIAILDSVAALNLNAIILQVRPQCDALYESKIEPWSAYLSGEQGKAPEPFYDPLEFWIMEAHKRGIELHAWFNPFRAHHPNGGELTETSIAKKRPDLVKKLDNGYYWLDPAKQENQDYLFDVVMDVVKRYDVDGIHFDDYFYPYGDGNFPDDDTWEAYLKKGKKIDRKDWRRKNINTIIKRIYKAIKKEKPYVKFGLSPFGIYRPGRPPSIKGFDQYDILYADAKLWLNKGWIDYWSPQLYWPISQIPQSYPVLLGWWVEENKKQRNVWPGLYTGKMIDTKGTDEILNQIMIARGFMPEGAGHIHFSMKVLKNNNGGINDALRKGLYKNQALIPPSPWLDKKAPNPPQIQTNVINDSLQISWMHEKEGDVFRWVVYYKLGESWDYRILNKAARTFKIPLEKVNKSDENGDENTIITKKFLTQIAVSAVDRIGNESEKILKKIKR